MSDDKCPRCGHKRHVPLGRQTMEARHHDPSVESWHCGSYREPSGNLYESELCETRQELRSYQQMCVEDSTRAGKVGLELSRERTRAEKAEAIISELMGIVPFGYIPAHTAENLPGRVRDFLAELCELNAREDRSAEWQERAKKAEAELVRLREENDMLRRDVAGMFDTELMLEAEIAKREKALDDLAKKAKKQELEIALRDEYIGYDFRPHLPSRREKAAETAAKQLLQSRALDDAIQLLTAIENQKDYLPQRLQILLEDANGFQYLGEYLRSIGK